jgi:hypothetical protein
MAMISINYVKQPVSRIRHILPCIIGMAAYSGTYIEVIIDG